MSYRYEERDQYEKHCPRCGAKADVDWIHVPTYGDPDQYLPGVAHCPTEGCPQNYGSAAWSPPGEAPQIQIVVSGGMSRGGQQ